jgi:hypothetical protein
LPAFLQSTVVDARVRHPAAHVPGGETVKETIDFVLHVAVPSFLQDVAQPVVLAPDLFGELEALLY